MFKLIITATLLLTCSSNLYASIFTETFSWKDQNNSDFSLSNLKDKPIVLTMMYTECTKTCPMLTVKSLTDLQEYYGSKNKDADFVIITLDPDHDNPAVLKKYMDDKKLNYPNWHFITGSKSDIRKASEFLGLSDYWSMDDHIIHGFKISIFKADRTLERIIDNNNRKIEE